MVQLVGESWMVDWVFQSDWSWDDEFEILWSSQAYNHTGYGLAPATSLSGGLGTPGAVENDLEIDFVQFTDQLDRVIEFAPGTLITLIPFLIKSLTKLYPGSEISGDPASLIKTIEQFFWYLDILLIYKKL